MPKRTHLSLLLSLCLSSGFSFNAYAGPVCGDSVVEGSEECDNGGNTPDNQCTNNSSQGNGPCTLTFCGDTVPQDPNGAGFSEDCDDGPGGSASCTTMCETPTTTTTTSTTTTTTGATTSTTTAASTTTTTGMSTTTTTAAPTTTTTAAATTTTTGAGTTTTTAAATTTTTATPTTTTTAAATTTTTMGGGPTTTTTTTAAATTTTAAATTTTTLPPGDDSVDVPLGDGEESVTITTENGETLSDVTTGDAENGPNNVAFPFGTIGYTTTSPVGGSVNIRLEFSSNLPDDLVLYKVDQNGKFTELPKSLWNKIDARTVVIIVTDGDDLTDGDGKVNGFILDPVAVGGETFDFGGSGGCTIGNTQSAGMDPIWLFLLMVPGIGLMRRKLNR